MKRLTFLVALLWPLAAWAQLVPNLNPVPGNAWTYFGPTLGGGWGTALVGPGGTSGQIQWNNGGVMAGLTIGGDCTLATPSGLMTCLKTNGVAFAPSATIDTTNASNIASGTLDPARATGLMAITASNATLPAARTNLFPTPTLNNCLTGTGTDWASGPCGVGTAMATNAANAALPTARANLGLGIVSPKDYGAIADAASHPLSGFYASAAAAAAVCPSLNYLVGTVHAGDTNTSTALTNVATTSPYVITGMTVTDTAGDIPAATTVTAVNYATGAVTISQAATGSHAGDTLTFGFGVNWANVEMDWCAIDAAISAVRASGGATAQYYKSVFIPNGQYLINQPINLTCLDAPGVAGTNCSNAADHGYMDFYGNGAVIVCNTWASYSGSCLDTLSSNFVIMRDFGVYAGISSGAGCTGTKMTRGIQVGKAVNGINGAASRLSNVRVNGCFSQAPYYNLADEGSQTEHSNFSNMDATGTAYQGIWDGGNHFLVRSNYTNVTITQDQNQTFNDPSDKDSTFSPTGSGIGGIFIYGTRRLVLDQTYVNTATTSNPCVTLYNDSAGGDQSIASTMKANIHCEGSSNSTFAVVSKTAASTPTIKNLTYSDHINFAATTIFALGANTTGVTLQNLKTDIAAFIHTPNFFDTPAAYTLTGIDVRLQSGFAGWNATAGWSGNECAGASCQSGPLTVGGALTTTAANDITAGGSLRVGSGGCVTSGCLYSDANWGILFAAKSAGTSDFGWFNSAIAQQMTLKNGQLVLGKAGTLKGILLLSSVGAGSLSLSIPNTAVNGAIVFPAGVTDFSATGPGLLQQASAGSAITVSNTVGSLTVTGLTGVPNPTNPLDAVNKQTTDAIAAGNPVHPAVYAASTANLSATATGAGVGFTLTNNSTQVAFALDGVTVPAGQRVLIKDQTLAQHDGIFDVTNAGSGSTNWVLTRSTDFDQASASEIVAGAQVAVLANGTQAGFLFYQDALGPFTVDTTPLHFTHINATSNNGSVAAGSINQLGYYAAAGTAISGLANCTSGVYVTDGSKVPSCSTTLPSGIAATSMALTAPGIGAATGASLAVTGQLTSSVATGTPPLVVTSTTNVPNLNASSLSGATMAAPGAIGGGTPAAGTFTSLTGTSGSLTGLTALGVRDTSAVFDVTLAATSAPALTAGRSLFFNVGNVQHTLALGTTAGTITFPNSAAYTVIGSSDTGTVTNTMLAGSIAASKLVGTDIATVGALSSGSIAAGFGSIATANPITTTNATASTTTGTGAVIVTGGVGIGGALNVGGAAKVASLTGTATNDNAPAGAVGEEINASASAVSLVSTTAKTIATLSLTAGDWEVEARVKFNYAATTTSTWRAAGISLTTNVMPTTLTDTTALAIQSGAITTALTGPALPTGAARESLAGSTNIFCVAQSTFATSTATADCLIRARRVR